MKTNAPKAALPRRSRTKEASFTLLETIIAVGLMVTVILEVSNVQGSAINFTKFDRKVTQATWLAKAVMSKIEWGHRRYELKELASSGKAKEQEFDERLCPKDPEFDCDFKYNVDIEEWTLPLVDILTGAMGGGGSSSEEEGDEAPKNPFADMIKQYIDTIFGEDLLKIAHVEVYWPEGSKRNSVELSYLLPNQRALNRFILEQKGFRRQGAPAPAAQGAPGAGPGAVPGAAGAPGAGGAPGGAGDPRNGGVMPGPAPGVGGTTPDPMIPPGDDLP